MNHKKLVVVIAVVVVVFMGLNPPWKITHHTNYFSKDTPIGHYSIYNPPKPVAEDARAGLQIDWTRLLLEWFVVLASSGLVLYLTREFSDDWLKTHVIDRYFKT